MKKGVTILIPVILIMLVVSILAGLFLFGQKVVIEKRSLQEKILTEGNRLELTGKSIQMASDLATLQAIKDIGQGYVVKSDTSIKYNPAEKLPYWYVVPRDEIQENIRLLAKSYFRNYFNGYENFFENQQTSRGRYMYWDVGWQQDASIEVFDNQKISIDFGTFSINYNEPETNPVIKISKEFPIISSIKTNFVQLLDVSQQIIDKIKSGQDLTSIENQLETEIITIEMEDKGDYVYVFIYENQQYKFYDISINDRKPDYLGVKFLVDKNMKCYCSIESCYGGCQWATQWTPSRPFSCSTTFCEYLSQPSVGIDINSLSGTIECNSGFIVISPNNNFDICSIIT